ncbi:Tubulin-tyrosine ligase-related protein [Handroanthus impetiginosus]|uniref:Tubulin-tyrosine ligase-related protein n=1 Tax=Handroanthus impetiginosus TaxID=429701 RepID=A0A2G9I012_9LAMI|nr:Tubulin-tyrosine ligase-related protein [Handroanthus impetiginosus]
MSAAATGIERYEDFVKVHGVLLAASGLPQPLHRKLFQKLRVETFDGGNYFRVEPVEDGRQRRLVLTADFLGKDSDVFLVDHAWTFRLPDAYKHLQEVPGLVERMAALMCVDTDLNSEAEEPDDEDDAKVSATEVVEREFCKVKEEGVNSVRWLELEDLEIDDDLLVSLDLPTKFPHLLALSLRGNKLGNSEMLVKAVAQFKHHENLILCDNNLEDAILLKCPELEIYNSRFTSRYGEWALGFCAGLYEKDNPGGSYQSDHPLQSVTSLDLSNRSIHNLNTKAFSPSEMPVLSYLNLRGNPLNENSVDDPLKYLRGFINLTALEVDIPGPLGENAIDIIEALPTLSLLNGLSTAKILESEKSIVDTMLKPRLPEFNAGESLIDRVVNAMWLYVMTYRLADEEKIDETSVWYVMDELGSALRHSDEANFRVSPFLYMPDGKLESSVSYSILWPTKNVQRGDECTRDYLFGIGEDRQRSARLTAWFHTPQNYFIREYEKYSLKLHSKKFSPPPVMPSATRSLLRHDKSVLRVYTDIPQVEEFLTRPEFVITAEPKNADIIWTSTQVDEEVKKAVGLNDQHYINQFPFEACLVMKHHLAETVQKVHGAPRWLQPTYNLETHLTQLIGDYYTRESDGVDNLWILKPWNMARTIDTTVTQNLSAIIRLMETGPKICQKYIEHPVLFQGRKFDLRYIVLARSINPLEIFLADVFWVRLANNTYSLEKHSFFEYETHFTVMNYRGTLNHMNTPEFVKKFEQEHHVQWLDIHLRVKQMIRSVFEAAAAVHPEMHSPTSRAMYGVDVMLDCFYQPKLLEVTYCPDCTRACKYDTEAVTKGGGVVKGSDFYNYVFGCLFLNETTHVSPL